MLPRCTLLLRHDRIDELPGPGDGRFHRAEPNLEPIGDDNACYVGTRES